MPLTGIKILEFSGLGPTPFGAMLLADMGADILRIERLNVSNPLKGDPQYDFIYRGRPSISVDLKSDAGCNLVLDLAKQADVIIEGFRPGAMERLGLGPAEITTLNEKIIYARMSGWGQDGPFANKAGHDINYMAMSGALYPLGPFNGPPVPPLNLVGNFGGGGTFLALGILAALNERHQSNKGQVLDVAMVDGISVLLTQMVGWIQMGQWGAGRGGNLLDGSAYFYRCYETADQRHLAVGALEKNFHDAFVAGLGLDPLDFADHLNPTSWQGRAAQLELVIRDHTIDHWCNIFSELDACVTPVLSVREAAEHPASTMRNSSMISETSFQFAPAPRFSRTHLRMPEPKVTRPSAEVALGHWLIENRQIQEFLRDGIVA